MTSSAQWPCRREITPGHVVDQIVAAAQGIGGEPSDQPDDRTHRGGGRPREFLLNAREAIQGGKQSLVEHDAHQPRDCAQNREEGQHFQVRDGKRGNLERGQLPSCEPRDDVGGGGGEKRGAKNDGSEIALKPLPARRQVLRAGH